MSIARPLSEAVAACLLEIARRSITGYFDGEPLPRPGFDSPLLDERRGAFVTIKMKGMLRGCIGRIQSELPLWETVARVARSSAFDDPRFAPLSREEMDAAVIEISALTPMEPLDSPDTVEAAIHGVMIEMGQRRAVFLPQVAAEQGWDRDTLLEQLCLKAGLPQRAYNDPAAKLFVFQAEVIRERR